jgi:hypothetical protein
MQKMFLFVMTYVTINDMKRYYSSTKPYFKRKRLRIGFRIFKAILKLFFPKNEFIWKCERPGDNDSFIFVCNHTKLYAPLAFLLNYDKPIRTWSLAYLLFYKEMMRHMFFNILKDRKPKILLYPLTVILSPLILWFFRSIEPIPVYHQERKILDTFNKAVETAQSGVHQIVFPEDNKAPLANDYIFELHRGFTYVAKLLYDKTGKIMKFYPVYTSQKLRKVLIGPPISYDPQVKLKIQKEQICKYLENGIKELADSLPQHKITIAK